MVAVSSVVVRERRAHVKEGREDVDLQHGEPKNRVGRLVVHQKGDDGCSGVSRGLARW